MPLDGLADRIEVRVLDAGDVLRVETLGQRREPDEVGEEDGDDATFDRGSHGRRLGDVGHCAKRKGRRKSR